MFILNKWKSILLFLTPFLGIGVIYGFINFYALFFVFLFSLLFFNRDEVALISFLIFPKLLGLVLPLLGINVPGSLFGLIIGLLLMRKEHILTLFRLYEKPLKIIFTIYIIFCIYFIFTGNTATSNTKFVSLTLFFVLDLLVVIMFIKNNKINIDNISIAYTLYSVLLISFAYDFASYQRPASFLDIDSFRNSFYIHKSRLETMISYHTVGNSALISIAFFLSAFRNRISLLGVLFVILNIYLMLFSGARQSLVGLIVSFLIYIYVKYKRLNILIITVTVLLITLYILLPILNVQYINDILYSSSMNRNFDYPLKIINENLLLGIGFGNYYNPLTEEIYPHNILLEILCEMGLIASLMILLLFVYFFLDKRVSFCNVVQGNYFAIILMIPFLVRSMISDSIDENFIAIVLPLFLLYTPKITCEYEKKNTMYK